MTSSEDGHASCSALQQRGCVSNTAFRRHMDHTSFVEAATPDPSTGCADAMDSVCCESKCSHRGAASRERRSASRTAISSSGLHGTSSWSTDLEVKDSDPLSAMAEGARFRARQTRALARNSLLSSSYAPRAPAPCHRTHGRAHWHPAHPVVQPPPPPAVAAAAENPSAGSVGVATAGAPPTVGLARSLFLPPRTTATGGVAPAPSRAAAAPSKLPNAARSKKGKTSGKKNKAADGSGSSRGKKLAGWRTGAAATEAPASSLVEPAADAHHVFDEMPPSLNDDAYMSTMGVGSNNSHWSQTNDIHIEDHEFEVDEEGEGIVNVPKGRAGNYTTNDDKLLCNTWLQVSRDTSVGGDQSRDAYWGRMKEYFDAQNVSGIDRSERSLRSRWSTINSDCQKWAAAQKAVDKINPSGTNEDDRYNIAQNLFKEETRTTKKGKIKKEKIFTLPH
ncbi:putative receptor protein kinase ZmPK1 [Hordeum vulgare]|nr:putative receptor protein kinase ZmPK1 [Hordeum vulgare]